MLHLIIYNWFKIKYRMHSKRKFNYFLCSQKRKVIRICTFKYIPIFRNVMTVPVIDGIDHKTFEYRPVYQEGHLYRGIFEWGMLYKENELPRREAKTRAHNSMPYRYNFYFVNRADIFIII